MPWQLLRTGALATAGPFDPFCLLQSSVESSFTFNPCLLVVLRVLPTLGFFASL